MIEQVMLAEQYKPADAKFPYLATPKIDGIRFYVEGGHLWSRANKPIPNINIQYALRDLFPDGFDGELFTGTFNSSQSLVMSDQAPLEDAGLTVYIFDQHSPEMAYHKRMEVLFDYQRTMLTLGWRATKRGLSRPGKAFRVKFLYPLWVQTHQAVETYYTACLEAGHEGIILRTPLSRYTYGRSYDMLKYKPKEDREAVILGCEEQQHNTNEPYIDAVGRTKRSSAAAGKVGAGILGRFHVRDLHNGTEFFVGNGPGLTHLLRSQLWAERHTLGGKIVKYQCMPYGQKDKPRQPQFLGFRDERDL